MSKSFDDQIDFIKANNALGKIYLKLGKTSEALKVFLQAASSAKEQHALVDLSLSYQNLITAYSKLNDYKNAFNYQQLFIETQDSIFNSESTKKLSQLTLQSEFALKETADSLQHQSELNIKQIQITKQKTLNTIEIVSIGILSVLLFLVFRNFSKQKIANEKLKAAQLQLIESEKMAAFGTMASRMAHEIQNPMNFVLNFSIITKELLEDLQANLSEEEKKKTFQLINQNLDSVYQHGKKASEIVIELTKRSMEGKAHEFFS